MDVGLLAGTSLLSFSGIIYFKNLLQDLNDKLKIYSNTQIMTPSMLLNAASKNVGMIYPLSSILERRTVFL